MAYFNPNRKFYLLFPNLENVNTCVHNLEWSHIRRVLSVANTEPPKVEDINRTLKIQTCTWII